MDKIKLNTFFQGVIIEQGDHMVSMKLDTRDSSLIPHCLVLVPPLLLCERIDFGKINPTQDTTDCTHRWDIKDN